MKKIATASLVSIFLMLQSWRSYSFEVETHRRLSEQAVLRLESPFSPLNPALNFSTVEGNA